MNFKDRLGTAAFSLKDRKSGKKYTIKLQSNFLNQKKFEAATGTDNVTYYLALYANASTLNAPVEIIYNFMIDFYDEAEPNKSLVDQMDRDNVMGWLLNADDEENQGSGEDIKNAIISIMGEKYQKLIAETEKKAKKKDDIIPD